MAIEIRYATEARLAYLMGAVGASGGYLWVRPAGRCIVVGTLPNSEPLGDGKPIPLVEAIREGANAYLQYRHFATIDNAEWQRDAHYAGEFLTTIGAGNLAARIDAAYKRGGLEAAHVLVDGLPGTYSRSQPTSQSGGLHGADGVAD